MILVSLTLVNFRQYYGMQRIDFASSKDKSVTVIHGENGHGKTALLNAFSWCLYQHINLPNAEHLLNEKAEAEIQLGQLGEASVALVFSDNGRTYAVTRTVIYQRNSGVRLELFSGPHLTVTYIDETGTNQTSSNPQSTIDHMLPEEMRQYFFFDGERIDNLSKEDNTDEIQMAIKNLMGLEALERAVDHLQNVKGRFRQEQKRLGSKELKALIEQEQEYLNGIDDGEKECKQLYANERALDQAIETIMNRLRTLEASEALQLERDGLLTRKRDVEQLIAKKEGDLKTKISTEGYLAFADSFLSRVADLLENRRQRGEIPAGIKQQFVDDLLERQACICERALVPGTEPHAAVAFWRGLAGNNDLENKFIEVSSSLKVLEVKRVRLFEDLKRLKSEKDSLIKERGHIEGRIDEISDVLTSKEEEEIATLETQGREKKAQMKGLHQRLGAVSQTIETYKMNLDKAQKAIKDCKAQEAELALASARARACEEAQQGILEIHDSLAHIVRARLQERLDEVYGKFLRKGYTAVLSPKYELQILKDIGAEKRVVPMSQGERQITSLSFIGAIVDIARQQAEKKDATFFRGGIYPLVMDSPFGSLDPDHKKRVAHGIPKLAHQIVVMVTRSQWNGEVATGMKSFVGKEYYLHNYSPRKDNVPYEYTLIKEEPYA